MPSKKLVVRKPQWWYTEDGDFRFKEFDDLRATTITTVVYTNLYLEEEKLFYRLPIHEDVDHEKILTSKSSRKKYCKDFPVGTIVSVQFQDLVRGCIFRKSKKKWCNVCQLSQRDQQGDLFVDVQVKTVREVYRYDPVTKITKIMCYCTNCDTEYSPRDLKILSYFRNQVMVYVVTERNIANLMIFPSTTKVSLIKMAGSSSIKESRNTIARFWVNKIYPTGAAAPVDVPKFVFEEGMININLKFGPSIDLPKFYRVWDNLKKEGRVARVVYGCAGQKSVNIKFKKLFPDAKTLMEFSDPSNRRSYNLTRIIDFPDDIIHTKKKKKKIPQASVVVFMTSSTLLTGKSYEELKACYEYFTENVIGKEKILKEKIKMLDYSVLEELLSRPITS